MRFRPSLNSIVSLRPAWFSRRRYDPPMRRAREMRRLPQRTELKLPTWTGSVTPGDNFYLYANGDWIKRTVIPADRAGLGVFSTLDDTANKNTAALIQESAKANAPAGSEARKIADLYNSYMDESAIEAKGLTPLHSQLAAIAAIHTQRDLARALGESLRADVDPLNNTNFHTANLFGLWVAPGFHDPEHYHPYLLARRARAARPRVLPGRQRSHEGDPGEISDPHGSHVSARRI